MKTEEEIKQRYEEVRNAARESKTSEDKLYYYGRLALLEWVLESEVKE